MEILKEKIINNSDITKRAIININTNEYFFYNRENDNKNIIGFFTDGIVTCSCLIISINDDDFLFFSHIHEDSRIIPVIEERIIPTLKKIKIKNIIIMYSLSVGSIENKKKEILIDAVVGKISNILKPEIVVMKHTYLTGCLKLIKDLHNEDNKNNHNEDNKNNENYALLNKMIEFQKSLFEKKPKKKNVVPGFFINSNKMFKEGIFIGYNLVFIFDTNIMNLFSEKFDFLFKK